MSCGQRLICHPKRRRAAHSKLSRAPTAEGWSTQKPTTERFPLSGSKTRRLPNLRLTRAPQGAVRGAKGADEIRDSGYGYPEARIIDLVSRAATPSATADDGDPHADALQSKQTKAPPIPGRGLHSIRNQHVSAACGSLFRFDFGFHFAQ